MENDKPVHNTYSATQSLKHKIWVTLQLHSSPEGEGMSEDIVLTRPIIGGSTTIIHKELYC